MVNEFGVTPDGTQRWSHYMLGLLVKRERPVLGTVVGDEIEAKAKEKMQSVDKIGAFRYVQGSAGTCSTTRANREIFDKWRIIPHMLRDVTNKDFSTTIFGVKYSAPLFLAPIGVQAIVHPEAELATARAAAKVGVPMIMSTASSRSIEEVAKENGNGQRWYQLYWPVSDEITISLLNRAKDSGFTALVITLDTNSLGWRPHDLENSYLPFFHGTGIGVGTADPVFMARFGLKPHHDHAKFPYDPDTLDAKAKQGDEDTLRGIKLGTSWLAEVNSGKSRTWEDLKLIRENWSGPIVLKGIQSVEDAEKAVDWVDGIVVSNHGGRQVDGAIASLDALDKIASSTKIKAAQASGKFTVLFDSGIRTGSDILKALALGAQAILLGRPYIYGLTIAGQEGVEQVIRSILADFDITMGLSGYKNIDEIWRNRDALERK